MTPTKRRQYGTGSVFPAHKKGCPHHARRDVTKCWAAHGCRMRASYEAGYTKANKRKRPVVTGKTEAEVKRKLRDALRAIEVGQQASTRMTVKTWSDKWTALREKRRRPSSHNADLAAIRNWIVPTIGHVRLADLTADDIRSVASAAVSSGCTTTTARRYQATLMMLLKDALKERHPVPEHVLLVDPPAIALHDRTAFPIEDAVKMLAEAVKLPHGSRWAVAFLQGLRPGEARGLTVDSLDFSGELGRFTVEWQLQRLPYNIPRDRSSGFRVPDAYEVRQVAGGLHLVRPKTKSGKRAYPIVPWVRQSLTDWLDVAPTNTPGGLLWPMATDDKADTAEWEWLQDQAGVRHPSGRYYHRHEARHTTATLLRALRVPEHIIVAIMGHSSAVSTAAYEHADDPQMLAALLGLASQLQLTPRAAALGAP